MSFQAYLANIKKKTGKTPDDFHVLAETRGLVGSDVTAVQLVAWFEKDFGLGHGHAMAIWAVFKSKGWVTNGAKAKKPRQNQARTK